MPRTTFPMRNLGPAMARPLREIGVRHEDDLRAVGSVQAWRRLRLVSGREASVVARHAMDAALLDRGRRPLAPEVKARGGQEART